jgi:hypothetical protein
MPDPGPEEFSRALFKITDLIENAGAPYIVFGAVAVGIWGRVRATLDVDVMIRTDDVGLSRLEAAAEAAGLAVDRRWLEWNPQRRGIQLRLILDPYRADVVRTVDAHDHASLERRRHVDWRGRSLWVVSPEDLILQKLKAQRDQDLIDAVGIVEEQRGRLDQRHLDLWARRLGIEQELAYILTGGAFNFG